jgi:hypothetical protein
MATQMNNDLKQEQMSDFEDSLDEYYTYDNYNPMKDIKLQNKLPGASATRRRQINNRIIPEITEQRIKDREIKKTLKRAIYSEKKTANIMREQARSATGRRQILTKGDFVAIKQDNDLADAVEELFYYNQFYNNVYYQKYKYYCHSYSL